MENPIRILACDDSVTIRKALELILVPAGFQVEFAVNGAEAIEKVKPFGPSIILLDFILPDMRGTEVCRELLADPQTRLLPVVLISARGAEIRQAYHDVDNVVDYLTKPFTPDAVLGVISEVLATQPARLAAAAASAESPTPAAAEETVAPAPAEIAPAAVAAAPSPGPAVTPVPSERTENVAATTAPRPVRSGDTLARLEAMFETLRAGLEGVYVEETETGAAVKSSSDSYTELASCLAQQVGEAIEQAESRRPIRLCDDGSIRSLDESLFESYRRLCRLLFRAVAERAVAQEGSTRVRARLLVICGRDHEPRPALRELASEPGDAQVLLVSSEYAQLPILTRLYAPTHLVVDAGRGSAAWEQLKTVRGLPEGRRARLLAVGADAGEAARSSDLDVAVVVPPNEDLGEAIRRHVAGEAVAPEPDVEPTAFAASM